MFGYELQYVWTEGLFRLWGNDVDSIAPVILGWTLCIILSYLLGSLNFAIIISKYIIHDDVRTHGSGNAGMTNMLRTYGKGMAVATFLGDAVKAALAILVVGRLFCGIGGAYAAGMACIVGHVYPLYFNFKGGKGVVTTAIMILCLNPIVFAILLIIFVALVAFTKYMSLGSVMCMMIFPLVLYRFSGPGIHVLLAILIGAFVVWLHRSNIKRIINGTESKISFGSKKKTATAADKSEK